MPAHFFDSSAYAKHYVAEPGTPAVDALLAGPGPHLIAQLGRVELPSTFAKKVRVGEATPAGFTGNVLRFRRDVAAGLVQVVRMTRRDDLRAVRLIAAVGLRQNLRTLDALQLAVALRLRPAHPGLTFVSADQALLAVAAGHGLATVRV